MPRVVHFEIAVDDPERAVAFYRDAFGWKIEKWSGPMDYWLVTTGEANEPGIDGALTPRADAAAPIVNTIGVPSVEAFQEKITAAGGAVLAPKAAIPGVGYFALCRDTEGNPFGIIEADMSAQ
ncbi:MAG TPA: VOC family protein [Armatimonadota bacterium]|nr:VOC family protein [Armatimonadota bacterium]